MRRQTILTFLSALVILTQLAQPLGMAPAAAAPPSQRRAVPRPAPEPAALARPAWTRPTIEPQAPAPEPTPPTDLGLPAEPAGPGLPPFGIGNNNYGQSYNDVGNPEDHPGRHFAGPVNLINGNLFLTVGDHFFPAQGLSVQFARSYNSRDPISGTLGLGWTHSYNTAVIQGVGLTVTAGLTATIRNGDGSQHTYTYDGSEWDNPPGYYHTLTHNAAGDNWVRTHKNGVVEIFDSAGHLQVIADRNGNTVDLFYDGSNRLVQVLDSSGTRSLIFNNNIVSGTIESIVDPLGRATTYTYDSLGRLTQVGYPEGTTATYTYDGLNRLIAVNDPRLAPDMGPTQVGYHGSGHTQVITDALGSPTLFSYGSSQTVWQTPGGGQHVIAFDSLANVVADNTVVGILGPVGQQWVYSPTTVLPIQKTDANGLITQYEYDANGNLTRLVSPSGTETRYDYDLVHNNIVSTTDAGGQVTQYFYDGNGNLTQELKPATAPVVYAVDTNGNLLGVTNGGGVTTYTYDEFGNLLTVVDPAGNETTNEYDEVGRPITTTDPGGFATVYEYDAADRLVRVTDPLSGTIEYEYDAYSNLTRLTDQDGGVITQTYNSLNRLTSVTDNVGNAVSYQWDLAGRLVLRTDATALTTTYTYDGASRLVSRNYSDGRQDTFLYDPGGRLTAHSNGTASTNTGYDTEGRPVTVTVNALGFDAPVTAVYAYDARGNRTSATLTDSGGATSLTTYEYDAAGRLVQTTDNAGRVWTTTYDAAGRRATRTLPDNSHEEYTYDSRGNLLSVEHYDPGNGLVRSFNYTYDSRGSVTSELDGSQTAAYQYDALGRMTVANTPQGPISYAYSQTGMRTAITGPGGLNTTYTYDAAGRLTATNDRTYVYDAMGRRVAATGPDGESTFTYDGDLRLVQADTPGGILSFEYDSLGRLIRRTGGAAPEGLFLNGPRGLEAELTPNGEFSRTYTIDIEIVALRLVSVGPLEVADLHYDGRGRVRWVTNGLGDTIAEYDTDPSGGLDSFYNPIRLSGAYFFPELNLYLIGDGLFWDPVTGVFLCRFWPWSFWPFGPFSAWRPIFRFWPWQWLWPRPWGWAWPRPWAFLWPWPGAWVRPWVIWPLWPWPTQPWWPWWWWWQWWWWPWWGHWWHWGWWVWWHGWWWWPWWGHWWWWHWWWPWWWWSPCWWMWWIWWWPWWWGWWWHWWWWPWWWWGWWWWWWGWWWWWWWWDWWWWWPLAPRPPDYGDAPDPLYPSLRENDGARHLNPDYEWLGPGRSREYNAWVTNLDTFDDGVTVNLPAGVVSFTVSVSGYWWRYSAVNPLHVHGWIDFNGDGDWADPGEMVVNWSGYPGSGGWPAFTLSRTVALTITVPPGAVGSTWARFRLDYDENVESVTGPARYGEVEDHPVVVPRLYLPIILK